MAHNHASSVHVLLRSEHIIDVCMQCAFCDEYTCKYIAIQGEHISPQSTEYEPHWHQLCQTYGTQIGMLLTATILLQMNTIT